MTDSDDESIEINSRTRREVSARLIVLGAVLTRIGLETNAPIGGDDEDIADAEGDRFDLLEWLIDRDLSGSISANERALLQTPIGALPYESVSESSWQAERFAVIAWAASLLDELPEPDRQADISAPLTYIPKPWDDTEAFANSIGLRSDEDVVVELERAEIWLWRAETEQARKNAVRAELAEIALAIAEVAEEAAESGLIERAPDGDFLAHGKPFHLLGADQQDAIGAIAAEHLRAFNWLRGAEDDWDRLSTET